MTLDGVSAETAHPGETFSAPMGKTPRALRVLVVDDELLIRWSLTETLTQSGHAVTEAGDAQAAIAAITAGAQPPDVVLLDYRLPDSNDLGLLTTIRRLAPDAAVIMMTAFGTPEVVRAAMDLGAYRVVSKPFEVQDLAGLVEQADASRPH